MNKPYVLAVASHKGGTGRTTCALYLSYALAASGKRVLLVDGNPTATLELFVKAEDREIMPGVFLGSGTRGEAQALAADVVVVDSPPLLDEGALEFAARADGVVLTTLPDPLAFHTIPSATAALATAKQRNANLQFLGVCVAMYDARDPLQAEMLGELHDNLGDLCITPAIRFSPALSQWALSPSIPKLSSEDAQCFDALRDELLRRAETPPGTQASTTDKNEASETPASSDEKQTRSVQPFGRQTPYYLAIASHKGGTGRTLSTLGLAWAFGQLGLQVAVLDGNPTKTIGLMDSSKVGELFPGVLYLESNDDPRLSDMDMVVIDSPPVLDDASLEYVKSADGVILTTLPDPLAFHTLPGATSALARAKANNPEMEFLGVLVSVYQDQDALQVEMFDELRTQLGQLCLQQCIPWQLEWAEWGRSPGTEPPSGPAQDAVRELAQLLCERAGLLSSAVDDDSTPGAEHHSVEGENSAITASDQEAHEHSLDGVEFDAYIMAIACTGSASDRAQLLRLLGEQFQGRGRRVALVENATDRRHTQGNRKPVEIYPDVFLCTGTAESVVAVRPDLVLFQCDIHEDSEASEFLSAADGVILVSPPSPFDLHEVPAAVTALQQLVHQHSNLTVHGVFSSSYAHLGVAARGFLRSMEEQLGDLIVGAGLAWPEQNGGATGTASNAASSTEQGWRELASTIEDKAFGTCSLSLPSSSVEEEQDVAQPTAPELEEPETRVLVRVLVEQGTAEEPISLVAHACGQTLAVAAGSSAASVETIALDTASTSAVSDLQETMRNSPLDEAQPAIYVLPASMQLELAAAIVSQHQQQMPALAVMHTADDASARERAAEWHEEFRAKLQNSPLGAVVSEIREPNTEHILCHQALAAWERSPSTGPRCIIQPLRDRLDAVGRALRPTIEPEPLTLSWGSTDDGQGGFGASELSGFESEAEAFGLLSPDELMALSGSDSKQKRLVVLSPLQEQLAADVTVALCYLAQVTGLSVVAVDASETPSLEEGAAHSALPSPLEVISGEHDLPCMSSERTVVVDAGCGTRTSAKAHTRDADLIIMVLPDSERSEHITPQEAYAHPSIFYADSAEDLILHLLQALQLRESSLNANQYTSLRGVLADASIHIAHWKPSTLHSVLGTNSEGCCEDSLDSYAELLSLVEHMRLAGDTTDAHQLAETPVEDVIVDGVISMPGNLEGLGWGSSASELSTTLQLFPADAELAPLDGFELEADSSRTALFQSQIRTASAYSRPYDGKAVPNEPSVLSLGVQSGTAKTTDVRHRVLQCMLRAYGREVAAGYDSTQSTSTAVLGDAPDIKLLLGLTALAAGNGALALQFLQQLRGFETVVGRELSRFQLQAVFSVEMQPGVVVHLGAHSQALWLALCLAHMQQGQVDAARDCMREYIAHAPGDSTALEWGRSLGGVRVAEQSNTAD